MMSLGLTGVLWMTAAERSHAQIADGSLLQNNLIITDYDGQEWNVFEMLDEGKTVVLDLFAEWCGPCWNYHHSGQLASLYEQYGPDGTNELMVIAVETDPSTPPTSLDGGVGSSYGWDWTEGVPYPVADMNLAGVFQQQSYPYILRICPNRQIYELGQAATAQLYSGVGSCLSASGEYNPHLLEYRGETESCGQINLRARIQNLGTETLEEATFNINVGGETISSYTWTGSLNTYSWADIDLGTIQISQNTIIQIATDDLDEDPSSIHKLLSFTGVSTTNQVTLRFRPDSNPHETTWEVRNGSGEVVASGGPYTEDDIGVMKFETFTTDLGCHEISIYDEGGDGMSGELHMIYDSEITVIGAGGGGTDWSVKTYSFKPTSNVVGVEDASHGHAVHFYPNPTHGRIQLDIRLNSPEEIGLRVFDAAGRTVYQEHLGTVDAGGITHRVNLGHLQPGIYFAEIAGTSGKFRMGEKVVIAQ